MNTCDRCENKEGEVECRQCSGKPDTVVYYCVECSALVHVGRTLALHEIRPCKTKFQTEIEDAEQMLETYRRSLESLKMRKKEIENAVDNVHEQQRIFERALRESVFRAQQIIMNHAKEYRNAAKHMITAKEQELQSCLEECDSKIRQASQIENEVKRDVQCASSDKSNESLENLSEKLSTDMLTLQIGNLNSLFVDLPVVDYTAVIDKINKMDPTKISNIEAEVKKCGTIPAPVQNDFETSITVSSQINNKGTFWAVPVLDEQTSLRLNTMNLEIRKKYITDPSWKTFSVLQAIPKEDDKVFIRYKMDRKWYRGVVEKAHDTQCEVRFMDYGTMHTTNYDNILPYSDELFPGIPGQAVHCCLFDKELENSLQNEARWHFAKVTGDWVIQAHFKHQVEVEGRNVWYVDLTYQDGETSSTISIRDEIEKKNKHVSKPRDGVIGCTDVRLLDNPGSKFTISSVSTESNPVESKNTIVDSEEVVEDKLNVLAESLVDNVLMTSTQMLTGCDNTDAEISYWNMNSGLGIEANSIAEGDFETETVPTNTDADFGHFLNVDAKEFVLDESTGFSPGMTNESGSFDSPTAVERNTFNETYNTGNMQLAQFWESFKDLAPPKDEDSETRPRTPRPILGKEFKAQPQDAGGISSEIKTSYADICSREPDQNDAILSSARNYNADKISLHREYLRSDTYKVCTEDSSIAAKSMENLLQCPEANAKISEDFDLENIYQPSIASNQEDGGDILLTAISGKTSLDKSEVDRRVWEPEIKKFEDSTRYCSSPNLEITNMETMFRTNENRDAGCENRDTFSADETPIFSTSLLNIGTSTCAGVELQLSVKSDDDSRETSANIRRESPQGFQDSAIDQGEPHLSAEALFGGCNMEVTGNITSDALWEGVELECEVISQLEENGSFYVRIVKNTDERRKFQQELNVLGKVCTSIPPGKDYGLVENRGDFYRVQCQGQPDDSGRCTVLLIDEGRKMRVHMGKVKEAPDKIFHVVGQARLVSIATEGHLTFSEEERKIFHTITSKRRAKFVLKVTGVNRHVCYVDLNEVSRGGDNVFDPRNVLLQILETVPKPHSAPQSRQSSLNQSVQMMFAQARQASPVKVMTAPLQRQNAVSLSCLVPRPHMDPDGRFSYIVAQNAVNVRQSASAPVSPSEQQMTGFPTTNADQRQGMFTVPMSRNPGGSHQSPRSRMGHAVEMPRLLETAFGFTTPGGGVSPRIPRQLNVAPQPPAPFLEHRPGMPPKPCYSYQITSDPMAAGSMSHVPHQLIPMPPPTVTSPPAPVVIHPTVSNTVESSLRAILSRPHGPNAYGSTPVRHHEAVHTRSEWFRHSSPPIPDMEGMVTGRQDSVTPSDGEKHYAGNDVEREAEAKVFPEIPDTSGDFGGANVTDYERNADVDGIPDEAAEDECMSTEPSDPTVAWPDPTTVEQEQDSFGAKESYAKTAAKIPTRHDGQGWSSAERSPGSLGFGRNKGKLGRMNDRKKGVRSGNSMTCWECQGEGHKQQDCPQKRQSSPSRPLKEQFFGHSKGDRSVRGWKSAEYLQDPRSQPNHTTEQQKKRRQGSRKNSQSSTHTEEEW